MGSANGFYSCDEFNLEAKWLIDPKLLFVGPKIGEGAHAKVYEGKYRNQNVAIKIVHRGETPEEITKREARFGREVAMLSRVQHKNLVKVSFLSPKLVFGYDLFDERLRRLNELLTLVIGFHFIFHLQFIGACKEPVMVIVTELLLGGTLRKYLVSMRPRCLDTAVAIRFALDIARGMECLHSHGIIHRDLKPENLLLTADHKTVKLADFGLAREESLTEMMTAETGTYRWMAPELYSTVTLRHGEKKHYNHKVDAYSFAIVLWELIHNKLPFEGMSNLQAAYAAAFKSVRPSTDDLPEDLAVIVTSCWKEDPNTRPNFTQIIQMLLHFLSSVSPPEPVIPARIFTSENHVLPPESPGTSALMIKRDDSGETPKTPMENQPRGFFFCFNQCY
ncbi:serine/threonine-protein kinase STY13-like isoform X1 [Lycium ferocissimum]|uniref:serine/threonine-protein kinase STY13-like isoform X1 n=1 Tax=Lycium ferocissimum TaxID=112874 RepID=UPI0028164A6B|nr:serine/threonine-protein kinase STY13-like isoform X1 [Lycium ferocissimum]